MEGKVEKSDSVTKCRAAEAIFQSFLELLKIRMYEEENVEKMWHNDSGESGTSKLEHKSW